MHWLVRESRPKCITVLAEGSLRLMASKHISLPLPFAAGDPTEWFNEWSDAVKVLRITGGWCSCSLNGTVWSREGKLPEGQSSNDYQNDPDVASHISGPAGPNLSELFISLVQVCKKKCSWPVQYSFPQRWSLDWIGLDSLFSQRKPLANGYYTRHPENCTGEKRKKRMEKSIQPCRLT